MNKLVLIDGNAILHRSFHALPPLTTKSGEPINAVYGLISMLLRIIQDLRPTHIAVIFDEKEPTFRHIALKTYQAQRPPMASELSSQFEKARSFLTAIGIPYYSKPGFEADDVIGTMATVSAQKKEDQEVIIVTGDKDQLQLVSDKDNIRLYMPIVGLSNAKFFNEVGVIERMEVPASQIDDYKALVGDPSDNYGGVRGIGPKTAVGLLQKYGSFENIYKNLKDISENTRVKLEEGREGGELSKKLATIVRDVPVEFNFDEMNKWKINSPEVISLFEDFGFKTLLKRIKDYGTQIEKENQGSLF